MATLIPNAYAMTRISSSDLNDWFVKEPDNDTSVTKLARHYWGEVKILCALAKQLIDQKNYYFHILILVGIFFMSNSVI